MGAWQQQQAEIVLTVFTFSLPPSVLYLLETIVSLAAVVWACQAMLTPPLFELVMGALHDMPKQRLQRTWWEREHCMRSPNDGCEGDYRDPGENDIVIMMGYF